MESLRLLTHVLGQPWAIQFEVGQQLLDILKRRALGERLAPADLAQRLEAARAARPVPAPRGGGAAGGGAIAVIPIHGVVAHRAALVGDVSQPRGTSTEAIATQVRAAIRDDEVQALVLDVDSPGGGVFGVPELARELREARTTKPVVAVANSLAASAAYWLAAQASELVVTPSGQVGSIGVYALHEDWSRFEEQRGVTTTFVHAGRYKVEGHPFAPLSPDAHAEMQRQVDAYFDTFTADVAAGRRQSLATVRGARFGEGRVVLAAEAVSRGLADRVATFDQVLRELTTHTWRAPTGAPATATTDLRRRRLALARLEAGLPMPGR